MASNGPHVPAEAKFGLVVLIWLVTLGRIARNGTKKNLEMEFPFLLCSTVAGPCRLEVLAKFPVTRLDLVNYDS